MKKIAFLFSGQGAQYPGMVKDLYEAKDSCNQIFRTADRVLGRSISDLCFHGSQEDLNLTKNTQPCILAADLAVYSAIREEGIVPDAVAGFSLGEYAALAAAGVMTVEDTFVFVQTRADCMQAAVPEGRGAMAAVGGLDEKGVLELCGQVKGYVEPANYNCPGQIVVSGEADAIGQIVSLSGIKGIKAMVLPVSAPFHCKMMEAAAESMSKALEHIIFADPFCPIYMNVDALPAITAFEMKKKLITQAKSPVQWEQTIRNMYEDGITTFIELGPGKTLSGFVKKILKGKEKIKILRVSDEQTLEQTVNDLRGGKNDSIRI